MHMAYIRVSVCVGRTLLTHAVLYGKSGLLKKLLEINPKFLIYFSQSVTYQSHWQI